VLNRREVEPSLHPHAPLVIEALKPKRALPHLRELKQVFGLKANKGDADYHEEVAFAGGLRNQYRGALSHDTELRECLGLKANKGDADYHGRRVAGGLRDMYRGALPHVTELRECFGLRQNKGDADYHGEVVIAIALRNQYRGAICHLKELREVCDREVCGLLGKPGDKDCKVRIEDSSLSLFSLSLSLSFSTYIPM